MSRRRRGTEIRSHHLETAPVCPDCRATLDGATGVSGIRAPAPANVTVCVYCAAVLVFTEELDLRRATAEELVRVEANPYLGIAREVVHAAIARRRRT